MKAHPHIVNDLYQSNKHLLDGIEDWTPLDVGLDYEECFTYEENSLLLTITLEEKFFALCKELSIKIA